MATLPSDAFVFFGATGDLAYRRSGTDPAGAIPHRRWAQHDADNTLLNNDRVLDDLLLHIEREFGAARRDR